MQRGRFFAGDLDYEVTYRTAEIAIQRVAKFCVAQYGVRQTHDGWAPSALANDTCFRGLQCFNKRKHLRRRR
jgi:hypothetical protein